MFEMIHHRLKKHSYKIALGVPMIFLLASSLTLVRDSEEMCIVPDDNRYVEVGETVTLHVIANADEPVNVISATITYPTDLITVEYVSRENSIVDLWSEEPSIEDGSGTVHFSGGIVSDDGFLGNGTVITLNTKPKAPGNATIEFADTKMLAHDGTGMEVACGSSPITLSIRPETYPSPDINGDKRVNLYDFGIVSARLFMAYQRPYDLNLDGKIDVGDIGVLLTNMKGTARLGSLAISWSR